MASGALRVDARKETQKIVSFISKVVSGSSAGGAVIGLSGGVDSSVVGALCVRALGRKRVFALLMPSDHTPKKDVEDAEGLVSTWGIGSDMVSISKIVRSIIASSGIRGTKVARANVEARVRMMLLYYHANSLGYLVAGTGDRSESLIGYYTKGGDGMVDFLPIAHLFKTQVRQLGEHLGLPRHVTEKPASPQLWPGHKASDEIPADYGKLDIVLHHIFDLRSSSKVAATEAGLPVSVVDRVIEMNRKTAHKRALPPSLA